MWLVEFTVHFRVKILFRLISFFRAACEHLPVAVKASQQGSSCLCQCAFLVLHPKYVLSLSLLAKVVLPSSGGNSDCKNLTNNSLCLISVGERERDRQRLRLRLFVCVCSLCTQARGPLCSQPHSPSTHFYGCRGTFIQ